MNAIILGAGRGTRLGAVGRATPKILVEVGGEAILTRQIRYLKRGGVQRIVLNAHHLAEQVEDFVSRHAETADVEVVVEPELLGTAGGVLNALPRLGPDPFVVLYGDVIVDEPIEAVVRTHSDARADATITVYESTEVEGKGIVEMSSDGSVVRFREKDVSNSTRKVFVNAGLYILKPSLLEEFPRGSILDFGHDVLPRAVQRGSQIVGHVLPHPVIDMGTPAALRLARESA